MAAIGLLESVMKALNLGGGSVGESHPATTHVTGVCRLGARGNSDVSVTTS